MLRSRGVPVAGVLRNHVFLRTRCVAGWRHCGGPGDIPDGPAGPPPPAPPGKQLEACAAWKGPQMPCLEHMGTYNIPGKRHHEERPHALDIRVGASSPRGNKPNFIFFYR